MEDTLHFIHDAVERQRQVLASDFEELLRLQREQFQAQISELNKKHEERKKALKARLKEEEEKAQWERRRKKMLRLAGEKIAEKHVGMGKERVVFSEWKWRTRKRKRRVHLDAYCRGFYRRGLLRMVVGAWKGSTDLSFRSRAAQMLESTAKETQERAFAECNSELATLRNMVRDLTEDLRRETEAKRAMRRNFEASLLRSISALDTENADVQRDILRHTHEMSAVSRSLVYSASEGR